MTPVLKCYSSATDDPRKEFVLVLVPSGANRSNTIGTEEGCPKRKGSEPLNHLINHQQHGLAETTFMFR
jgi:hypothetical protein